MFLHQMGSTVHIVRSSVSGARIVDIVFSCSCGSSSDPTKSVAGHITPNLCSCLLWDLRVTYSVLVRPRHEM
jgi:hypothetical protein